MKNKIIVRITDNLNLHGFKCLGNVFENIHIVWQNRIPKNIYGSVNQDYSDIVIDEHMNSENMPIKPFHDNKITICRLSKDDQATELKKHTDKFPDLKYYKELKTYSYDKAIPDYIPDGEYMLKPTLGARSLGIMEFDTKRITPHYINHILESRSEKTADKIEEMLNDAGVQLIEARTLSEGERYVTLQHNYEYLAQEKNTCKDVKEIRVIKCLDLYPLMVERKNLDGSSSNINPIYRCENNDEMLLLDEAIRVIYDINFPLVYGSVDLWISEKDMKWGIYEFQPQYAYKYIDQKEHRLFMEKAIKRLVEECNKDQ